MLTKILKCNPLILPNHSELYREPPRPHEKMGPAYLTRYDGHTLAVDVFNAGDFVRMVGPPLLNLTAEMSNATITFDNYGCELFNWTDFHKISRARVQKRGSVEEVTLSIGREVLKANVAGDDLSTFEGKNALITMNKNNRLENIADWARNFNLNHGINALILYDNRSYSYSLNDIADVLKGSGLDVVYLVDWPFKFGNTGGKEQIWDSDFGIYMCWEHARWRFLQRANSVFISDVDEFPVSNSGASLVKLVEKSSHGVIAYPVKNVPAVPREGLSPERVRLHSDYPYQNRKFGLFSKKIGYQPTRLPEDVQVGNHNFYGWDDETEYLENVVAYHFRGIHYDWREGNWSYSHEDRAPIQGDETLDSVLEPALKSTFPERF